MDIHAKLKAHIEATTQRDEWARRALDLLKQGKEKEGRAAAKKAEAWDAKVKALEASTTSK